MPFLVVGPTNKKSPREEHDDGVSEPTFSGKSDQLAAENKYYRGGRRWRGGQGLQAGKVRLDRLHGSEERQSRQNSKLRVDN